MIGCKRSMSKRFAMLSTAAGSRRSIAATRNVWRIPPSPPRRQAMPGDVADRKRDSAVGKGNASYQSPPTSASSVAGRYVA